MNLSMDLNTITLLVVAIMNGLILFYTHKTERNTNSMKDALVESTRKEAYAIGLQDQLVKSETKAAAIAEGILQGQTVAQPSKNVTVSKIVSDEIITGKISSESKS